MNIPLFDAHCDTALQLLLRGCGLEKNSCHVDLARAGQYQPYAQFFALFVMTEDEVEEPCPPLRGLDFEAMFAREYELITAEIARHSDKIRLCRTAAEARQAGEEKLAAAFLSIEGAEAIGCSVKGLNRAYEMGVRAVNPVWNRDNALAASSASEAGGGLTELGRAFCREANRLGIILDVSHLHEQGFWELSELTERPFMASHSSSRRICGHPRNLSDEQFCELARRGGVAGINFYSEFIGETPKMADIIRHIEHFMSLGGGKSIAIGADFDGCDQLPEGVKGIESNSDLYEALLKMNYTEDVLRGIFYNNLMELVERVCDI